MREKTKIDPNYKSLVLALLQTSSRMMSVDTNHADSWWKIVQEIQDIIEIMATEIEELEGAVKDD